MDGEPEDGSGTLVVRLLIRDTIPAIHDWLRYGSESKSPAPQALYVYVLAASDLSYSGSYARLWLNGRQLPRLSAICSAVHNPTWEDNCAEVVGERFILPLGRQRGSINDQLLIELWADLTPNQNSQPVGHKHKFLGQCQIQGRMLRSPPTHRFDALLRLKAGIPYSTQPHVQGSVSIALSPRLMVSHVGDSVTHGAAAWTNHVRRERMLRLRRGTKNSPARTHGTAPQKCISVRKLSFSGISQEIRTVAIEIFYNRRRVALAEAKDASDSPKDDGPRSLDCGVPIEFPVGHAAIAGHEKAWPEVKLLLWKVAKENGLREGFLGMALIAGSKSTMMQPPLKYGRCPQGHDMKISLMPRYNVTRDAEGDVSTVVSLTACTLTEQSFSIDVDRWGADSFPYKLLAVQVPGSRGGSDKCDASATINWAGTRVGDTEFQPADSARRRHWGRCDFLLPMTLSPSDCILYISIRGAKSSSVKNGPSGVRSRFLGHAAIQLGIEGQVPPFCTTYALQSREIDVNSQCRIDPKLSNCLDLEEASVHQGRLPAILETGRIYHPPGRLGSVRVRLHQRSTQKPLVETAVVTEGSRARLRIAILGISGPLTKPDVAERPKRCIESPSLAGLMKSLATSQSYSAKLTPRSTRDLEDLSIAVCYGCQEKVVAAELALRSGGGGNYIGIQDRAPGSARVVAKSLGSGLGTWPWCALD